jgi:hypothetical protein
MAAVWSRSVTGFGRSGLASDIDIDISVVITREELAGVDLDDIRAAC